MQQPPNYPGGWQQPQQPNSQYPPQQWQGMPAQPKEAEWQPTPQYQQGFQPMPQQQQYYPPPAQYPQYPQQPYPMQPSPPFYQQPYPPHPMMQAVNVNVNVQRKGPSFLVRTIYFLFIGWWLGFFWLNLGFTLCALVLTLPIGLIMLNRLPQIMTLRQPGTTTKTNVSVATTSAMMQPGQMMSMQTVNVNVQVGDTKQINFLVRALYYIFVGFWVGAFWAYLAYSLCLTLVLLPVGVMMFNRLPAVLTLRRN